MRIALGVEYVGNAFNGWQRQKTGLGVQEELEKALSKVADEDIRLHCAGRTDTGVNAIGQVVHFDTTAERDEKAWTLGVNVNCHTECSVRWATPVADDFHARFSALSRTYRYIMHDSRPRSALLRGRVTHLHKTVDSDLMAEAAKKLIGRHDFTSFRAAECQANSPVREVLNCSVTRHGDLIYLDIEAHAFLHHMVRNIAGTLIKIGRAERPIEWIDELFEVKDRRQAGMTADPWGLYFMHAKYDEKFGLPQPVESAQLLNPFFP